MIALCRPFFFYLALLCSCLADVAATGAPAGMQASEILALWRRQPMIFFVAEGSPNACGPGCSKWIAAEGLIDIDAGQRLRDFLGELPRRDLPIFFNSNGGDSRQTAALGGALREHRLAAGVGRTVPEGCRSSGAVDDACRRVMQSKREHKARLVTAGARCLSACVYVFIGASVRQVARDAQLGIHSARVVPMPGHISTEQVPTVEQLNEMLKRYVIAMGVDPGLIDAAAKVSPDRIHYMSRDEIARFGIETRGFYETQWLPDNDSSQRPFIAKSVTQNEQADGGKFRTGQVRLACVVGGRVLLVFRRERFSNDADVASVIRASAGKSELTLYGSIARDAFELRYVSANPEFIRNAVAATHIEINEAFTPSGSAPAWSRVTRFSTDGLSKAAEHLQKDCGPAQPPLDAVKPGNEH
jgi:hypothetical protein